MKYEFPNDADGDALRRFVESGSDLAKPMSIDFQVAVPDENAAKGLAEIAYKLGYRVRLYPSPECSLPWTCECSARMMASYDAVIAIQKESDIASPFGGKPDGWGSLGNKPAERSEG